MDSRTPRMSIRVEKKAAAVKAELRKFLKCLNWTLKKFVQFCIYDNMQNLMIILIAGRTDICSLQEPIS